MSIDGKCKRTAANKTQLRVCESTRDVITIQPSISAKRLPVGRIDREYRCPLGHALLVIRWGYD